MRKFIWLFAMITAPLLSGAQSAASWPQAVEETLQAEAFSIYPNPSHGSITIQSQQPGEVHLSDLQGRVLMRRTVLKGTVRLQLPTALSEGIYLVELIAEDGSRTAVRLRYEP